MYILSNPQRIQFASVTCSHSQPTTFLAVKLVGRVPISSNVRAMSHTTCRLVFLIITALSIVSATGTKFIVLPNEAPMQSTTVAVSSSTYIQRNPTRLADDPCEITGGITSHNGSMWERKPSCPALTNTITRSAVVLRHRGSILRRKVLYRCPDPLKISSRTNRLQLRYLPPATRLSRVQT